MQTGSIHEDKLRFRQTEDAQLVAAGGLRFWRDGGDLLTEQRVDERGLTDIRPADHGYIPSAEFLFFHHFILQMGRPEPGLGFDCFFFRC